MKQRFLAAAILALLFWVGNRGAFRGYFSDDDLDNLSWATVAGTQGFIGQLFSLRFSEDNTRPAGALFYQAAGRAYRLSFPQYVAWLFAIHGLNCFLLWRLARKRGSTEFGAWAAVLLWGFHAGLLEAWWKPMYIFDLLCGTFCLVAWLCYRSGRTAWALLFFLFAYRAKEVAIFLPVALALDEWRRAWPFFLVSANFGLQAMWVNQGRDNPYTLRFSMQSLQVTVPFYLRAFVMKLWGALLISAIAWLARNRSLLTGVAGSLALMTPLLFLPGRLFEVYLYVPLIPLVLGVAAGWSQLNRRWAVILLVLWVTLSFTGLREKRNSELEIASEVRAYVQQMETLYAIAPFTPRVYCEGAPPGFAAHGVRGALRLITGDENAEVLAAKENGVTVLRWFRPRKALSVYTYREENAP